MGDRLYLHGQAGRERHGDAVVRLAGRPGQTLKRQVWVAGPASGAGRSPGGAEEDEGRTAARAPGWEHNQARYLSNS